jgi:amidohydrolase
MESLVRTRREIHRHPEPAFHENRTAELVAGRLRACGITPQTGIAGTGVRAIVQGRSPDPSAPRRAVLLRADMDALPLQELNEVDYASRNPGFMHACGHDGHTAMLLETAEMVARGEAAPGVDISFIFQPAEEGPGGALPMIEAGVLESPRPEACFGIHLWSELPSGRIAITSGPVMAASDEFEIAILGRGGHGAFPHTTIDTVVVGSYVVTALQTLVSRNVDPLQTAVVSVGTFEAGSNFNIIAERARLRGTLRTFNPALRSELVRRLQEVAVGTAEAMGARCEFRLMDHYPATVNDPVMSEFAAEVAAELVGTDHVMRDMVVMGGEDMSYFLQRVPGCFIFLGAGNQEKGIVYPHHSPHFDIDEDALPLGCELLLRLAERYPIRFPVPPAPES